MQKIYAKLLQYDITAAAFTNASTSYTGPVETASPSPSSPQIAYRKLFMRGYLQNLISDPTKPEFWAYLDKVGMMHTKHGRGREAGCKGGLDVEYVHIGACIGFIQDCLNEAILMHPRLKIERKIALVKALGKVLWIQNDLFAKWYVKDGEEFRGAQAVKVGVEDEGYLNGKIMLNTDFDDSAGSISASEVGTPNDEMGRCPFSGMMERMEGLGMKNEL